jgi:hypothetical protein
VDCAGIETALNAPTSWRCLGKATPVVLGTAGSGKATRAIHRGSVPWARVPLLHSRRLERELVGRQTMGDNLTTPRLTSFTGGCVSNPEPIQLCAHRGSSPERSYPRGWLSRSNLEV